MTPAEALRNLIANNDRDRTGHVDALREALQIVEGVAFVREALDAGARNFGASRAAYHYVLSTDGVAAWPAGIYGNPRRTEEGDFKSSHGAAWAAGYAAGNRDGYAEGQGMGPAEPTNNPWLP